MSSKINTSPFYKSIKLILVTVLFVITTQTYSQVAITSPSLTLTACDTFPTIAKTLGNIIIKETQANDIKTSGTLILETPANFQFISAGTASVLGTEITGVSIVLSSDTTITLSFTVNDTLQLDTLTLSGIQVRAITSATPTSNILNMGGTALVKGDSIGAIHATLESTDAPVLSNGSSIPAICSGDSVNYTPTSILGTTFSWTRDSISGISNPSNNGTNNLNESLTNTTNSPITVLYIYTLTANGCTNMDSLTVTVNPKPSVLTISNDTLCNADTISIPLSSTINSTYTWFAIDNTNTTGESTTNQTTDTINNIITNNTNTIELVNYAVIPTSTANSCIGDTTLFFVGIVPTVTVNTINDYVSCYRNELAVTLTSNIPATYTWLAANNNSVSGETITPVASDTVNDVLINNDTTMQVVTYSVTPTSIIKGCLGTTSTFIAILNRNNRITSNDSITICSGTILNHRITSQVTSNYNWIAADNINVLGESTTLQSNDTITDTIINTTNTLQILNYTIQATSVCPAEPQNLTVIIEPSLNLITNHTLAFCAGTTNNIGASAINNCTYLWTPNANLNDSTIANPIQTAINNTNNPIITNYYVIITDTINNCQNTDSVSVTINPQPNLIINNPPAVCFSNTIDLTDSLITSGSSNGTLSYWTNNLATDTLYFPNTISISDTNFIKLTAIGGCFDIDSVITIVNQQVIANAGENVVICSGTINNIGSQSINGIIYSWSPGFGLNDSTISNPIIVATNTTLNPYTTNYILVATDTTTNCFASDTTSVTINPQPSLVINQPLAVCQSSFINLANSAITQGSTGGNTYSYWQNSNATDTLLSTLISISDTNFIKLTAIGGCFDIDSVITIVNPLPIANAGNDISICSGVIDSIGSAPSSGYSYLWNPGIGLSDSTISNPQSTLTNTTNNPITTTYKLTTTITATGCKAYDSVSVIVNPKPTLVITNPPTSCESDSIDITDSSITVGSSPNVVYSYWTNSNATNPLLTPTTITVSDTNYIKITATGGCTDIKPVVTVINPLPLVNFTGLNNSNCLNSAPQLLIGNPAGGIFSGNGVVGDTFTAAIAGPGTQPVTYTYTDTNGCSRSASQFINILPSTNLNAELCMVTANTQSSRNIIYWNKDLYTSNVDSFIVYREIAPNDFQRIGAVSYSNGGQYTDTTVAQYFPNTGNPNIGSYRYKLQILDSCGVYTALSEFHQTMYLINNNGTFSWTPYMIDTSSTTIPELTSYILLRDGNNTGNWDVIASTSPSQLTVADPNYSSYPNGRWKIETLWNITCNPSNPLTKSTSNIVTDTSTSIGITENHSMATEFNIYPNPYTNNTTISYSLNATSDVKIEVYNTVGQKIITLANATQPKGKYNQAFSAKELGYNSGIYFVKINVNGVNTLKRIVELD